MLLPLTVTLLVNFSEAAEHVASFGPYTLNVSVPPPAAESPDRTAESLIAPPMSTPVSGFAVVVIFVTHFVPPFCHFSLRSPYCRLDVKLTMTGAADEVDLEEARRDSRMEGVRGVVVVAVPRRAVQRLRVVVDEDLREREVELGRVIARKIHLDVRAGAARS